MLKKIILSIMLVCVVMLPIAEVHAGLLDDLIEQGTDFGDSSSAAKQEEYQKRVAELTAEYNEKIQEVRDDSSLTTRQKNRKIAALREELREKKEAAADNLGGTLSNFITSEVKDVIWGIGNLIFAAITVILGVKYIWSGAEGKSQVQESLPTFVLAVIFFYLADPLLSFFLDTTTGITDADTWTELSGNFIWIINTVVKYLALGGLIFMGVRYLLASAEGKASLKTSMGGMVIGVLFVFLASNVVDFIVDFGNDILL